MAMRVHAILGRSKFASGGGNPLMQANFLPFRPMVGQRVLVPRIQVRVLWGKSQNGQVGKPPSHIGGRKPIRMRWTWMCLWS